MKLNLGSGLRPLEGYVNIDRMEQCNPDRVMNLETTPWPFSDNSCEEIIASHVLEHLGQNYRTFCDVIQEIHRILTPGGTLAIKVPHPRSEGFLGDPTHVRPITPQLMQLFSKKFCRLSIENNWPNTPLAIYLDIDLELDSTNFNLMPYWGQRLNEGNVTKTELDHAIASYNNVVDEITMIFHKVDPNAVIAAPLPTEIDSILPP